MKKIKKDILIFLSFFVTTLFILLIAYKTHYATDSYVIMSRGLKEYAKIILGNGRIIEYIILLAFSNLNISFINLYRIFLSITILLITTSIFITYKTFKNEKDNKLSTLILIISIFNIFITLSLSEMLIFIECLTMSLSILVSIIASKMFLKNKYVDTVILLLISGLSYQATVAIFIPYTILLYLKGKTEEIKISQIVKSFMFYFGVLGLCYLIIIIIKNMAVSIDNRIDSFNIVSNILYIINNIGFYGTITIIYNSAIIILILKDIKSNHNIPVNIYTISFGALLATTLLTFGSSSILSFRMMFALFAIPGLVGIYLYNNSDKFSSKRKKYIIYMQVIILIFNIRYIFLAY